jgi:hypothetical protein
MPITQILLTANRIVPTYTLTPAANDVDEGSSLEFTVGGTNIPNGTYVWIIETNSSDFETSSDIVTVTNNSGTFSVTPTADSATEGAQTFTVSLRANIYDPNLVTSSSVTINDTSTYSGTTFAWKGDANSWTVNGTVGSNSVYSDPAPANPGMVYSTYIGKTRDFTGSQYMISSLLNNSGAWPSNAIAIDFWFYPTANSVQLISEIDSQNPGAGYNYSVLEINGNNTVSAYFYDGTPFTSTNTVTLNQWNHIYFAEAANGSHTFKLNGVDTTGLPTYTRTGPGNTNEYFIVGASTATYHNTGITSRFQGRIGYLTISDYPAGSTYSATSSLFPTYTITPAASSVDEGSGLVFTVGGTNIPNGTFYWTVSGTGPFNAENGPFTITNNAGSITVTPTANQNTDNVSRPFTVSIRSYDIFGPVLATSSSVVINDTSQTPVPPFSLEFNQPQEDFLRVSASSDFNLGNNWTMEFWMSANNVSDAGINIPGGQWGLINQGGWYGGMANDNSILVGLAGGNLTINQSANDDIQFAEPTVGGVPYAVSDLNNQGGWNQAYYSNIATTGGTGSGLTVDVAAGGGGYINIGTISINNPGSGYTNGDVITINNENNLPAQFTISVTTQGVWTHVAIVNNGGGSAQKVYYNGVEQAKVSGSYTSNGKTNTSDDIYIGRLAPNSASHFDGKLAMIRISNAAKYLTAFTPSTAYGVESDTVLFLDSDTPLIRQSYYELNGLTASANGGNTIYFAKSTYPDLNNQVQVGDTVVSGSDPTTSVVTGAVFTPNGDPDNWGVLVSPGWLSLPGTISFSGTRSESVTNNGTTELESFPATYTVRQWLGSYSGPNNSDIFVLIADYPDAATIPAGATAVINGTVVKLENNASGTFSGQAVRQLGFLPQGTMVNAGTTITFTWTT